MLAIQVSQVIELSRARGCSQTSWVSSCAASECTSPPHVIAAGEFLQMRAQALGCNAALVFCVCPGHGACLVPGRQQPSALAHTLARPHASHSKGHVCSVWPGPSSGGWRPSLDCLRLSQCCNTITCMASVRRRLHQSVRRVLQMGFRVFRAQGSNPGLESADSRTPRGASEARRPALSGTRCIKVWVTGQGAAPGPWMSQPSGAWVG